MYSWLLTAPQYFLCTGDFTATEVCAQNHLKTHIHHCGRRSFTPWFYLVPPPSSPFQCFQHLLIPRISESAGWSSMSLIDISSRNQVGFLELHLFSICFHVLLKISNKVFFYSLFSHLFLYLIFLGILHFLRLFKWKNWVHVSLCNLNQIYLSMLVTSKAEKIKQHLSFRKPTSNCHSVAGRQLSGKECLCVRTRTWGQILSTNVKRPNMDGYFSNSRIRR